MTCPPQAGFVPKCGQKLTTLGGSWATGNFRGGAAAATKNVQLGSCVPFLSWRFSETVDFGAREMGLSGPRGVSWRFQLNTYIIVKTTFCVSLS